MNTSHTPLRRAVLLVALLNFAYFWVEFAVALHIDSVALFADSIDFLEDTAINLLIFAALGWSARRRSWVGMALAVILLIPGLFTLWTVWEKLAAPIAPSASLLSVTGVGALAINFSCAFILVRFRQHSDSLSRATFLSARNDALANVAIIIAGGITALSFSPWPDLLVGLGIFFINLDAAWEVFMAARAEHSIANQSNQNDLSS